ncbi:hypothetical protein R69919_03086 [Paraburkholderia gardini]|uniref:Uncharacterized protein n=1 Tax=Paraburkholderia gardini TaxID=2823469 RepID=A0ABM8U4R1_9BURK|nr:hypothetical protein R54767_02864 [Paraburkholderia gardini]CAG4903669.1 hypothetical protein R69919_03086 [Paraburkholderia gardini]
MRWTANQNLIEPDNKPICGNKHHGQYGHHDGREKQEAAKFLGFAKAFFSVGHGIGVCLGLRDFDVWYH